LAHSHEQAELVEIVVPRFVRTLVLPADCLNPTSSGSGSDTTIRAPFASTNRFESRRRRLVGNLEDGFVRILQGELAECGIARSAFGEPSHAASNFFVRPISHVSLDLIAG
jgi:hypothetical protein